MLALFVPFHLSSEQKVCLFKADSPSCPAGYTNVDIDKELKNYDYSHIVNPATTKIEFFLTASTVDKSGNPIFIKLDQMNQDGLEVTICSQSYLIRAYVTTFLKSDTIKSTFVFQSVKVSSAESTPLNTFYFTKITAFNTIFNIGAQDCAWLRCKSAYLDILTLNNFQGINYDEDLKIKLLHDYVGKSTTAIWCDHLNEIAFTGLDYDVSVTFFEQFVSFQKSTQHDFSSLNFEHCQASFNFDFDKSVHARFQSILNSATFNPIPTKITAVKGVEVEFEESAWLPLASSDIPQFTVEAKGDITITLTDSEVPVVIKGDDNNIKINLLTNFITIPTIDFSKQIEVIPINLQGEIKFTVQDLAVSIPQNAASTLKCSNANTIIVISKISTFKNNLALLGEAKYYVQKAEVPSTLDLAIDNFKLESDATIQLEFDSKTKASFAIYKEFTALPAKLTLYPRYKGLKEHIEDFDGHRLVTLPNNFDESLLNQLQLELPTTGFRGLIRGVSIYDIVYRQTPLKGFYLNKTTSINKVYSQFLFAKEETPIPEDTYLVAKNETEEGSLTETWMNMFTNKVASVSITIKKGAPYVPPFDFSKLFDSPVDLIIAYESDVKTEQLAVTVDSGFFGGGRHGHNIELRNIKLNTGKYNVSRFDLDTMKLDNSEITFSNYDLTNLRQLYADKLSITKLERLIPNVILSDSDANNLIKKINISDNLIALTYADGKTIEVRVPNQNTLTLTTPKEPAEVTIVCDNSKYSYSLPGLIYLGVGKTTVTVIGPETGSWNDYTKLVLVNPSNKIKLERTTVFPGTIQATSAYTLDLNAVADTQIQMNGPLDVRASLTIIPRGHKPLKVAELNFYDSGAVAGSIEADKVKVDSRPKGFDHKIDDLQITNSIVVHENSQLVAKKFNPKENNKYAIGYKYDIAQISYGEFNYPQAEKKYPKSVTIENTNDQFVSLTKEHIKQWETMPIYILCGEYLQCKEWSSITQMNKNPEFGHLLNVSCVDKDDKTQCLLLHANYKPPPTPLPTPPIKPDVKPSSNTGLIVGIVVVTVAFVVSFCGYFGYKFYRAKRTAGYVYENLDDPTL